MPLPPGGPMGGLQAAAPTSPDPSLGPDPSLQGPDLEGASSLLTEVLQSPDVLASPDLQDALTHILSLLGGPAGSGPQAGGPPGPGGPGGGAPPF